MKRSTTQNQPRNPLSSSLKILSGLVAFLIIVGATLWGAMALWYRFPAEGWLRALPSVLFVLLGFTTLVLRFRSRTLISLLPFGVSFALLLGWWATIQPPLDGNWSPDVARQVTGDIKGDDLTLKDVRDFSWKTDGSVTENWETKTYDLRQIETVDLFLSYWAGPSMAHFILSFGFADGQYLAWSIEVRRQVDGAFSPIADLFKESPLVIVAATEADVVGVRTNIRKEDVHLFRLRSNPETARELLEEYVRDANALAKKPEWYNSITTNCTTVVFKMLNAVGSGPSFDWRIIANGYLPEYGYERKSLNTNYSIDQLRQLGSVSPKGQSFGLRDGFSDALREGVPTSPSSN